MSQNPFIGTWTYRSLVNDPVLAGDPGTDPKAWAALFFGYGTIVIKEGSVPEELTGTSGGGVAPAGVVAWWRRGTP